MQKINVKKFLLVFPLLGLVLFAPRLVLAANNLVSASILNQHESSTKYFYNHVPVVSGVISGDVRGIIVTFDNIANSDDYSVTITQPYPSAIFTTQNDCFSSLLVSSACSNVIPIGMYRVTVEASLTIYDNPEILTFPKLLVVTDAGYAIDKTAPARPILDVQPNIVNADSITISGSAESGSLVTVAGNGQTKTQQLPFGATRFSIQMILAQNSQNSFYVTATDDAGNVSDVSSTMVQESSFSSAGESISESVSNIGNDTANSLSTPVVPPAGAIGTSGASLVKGTSTNTEIAGPSVGLMIAFYVSIVLFVIAWGLYFWKISRKKFSKKATEKPQKKSKS